MIIDIILDRKDGAISYDASKHLKAIYDYATDSGMTELATAVDGGTEDDVKAALMCYISTCGYPLELLDYIAGVRWTDDAPALEDLEMISMWEGVNYNPADINTFLETEADWPVAYSSVTAAGEVETIMETERMGYAARYAFNIADE